MKQNEKPKGKVGRPRAFNVKTRKEFLTHVRETGAYSRAVAKMGLSLNALYMEFTRTPKFRREAEGVLHTAKVDRASGVAQNALDHMQSLLQNSVKVKDDGSFTTTLSAAELGTIFNSVSKAAGYTETEKTSVKAIIGEGGEKKDFKGIAIEFVKGQAPQADEIETPIFQEEDTIITGTKVENENEDNENAE